MQEFPEVAAALQPLMQRYGVHAYFCGHEHNLQALRAPDEATRYIVSGAGSQTSAYGAEDGIRPEVQFFHPGSGGGFKHTLSDAEHVTLPAPSMQTLVYCILTHTGLHDYCMHAC